MEFLKPFLVTLFQDELKGAAALVKRQKWQVCYPQAKPSPTAGNSGAAAIPGSPAVVPAPRASPGTLSVLGRAHVSAKRKTNF